MPPPPSRAETARQPEPEAKCILDAELEADELIHLRHALEEEGGVLEIARVRDPEATSRELAELMDRDSLPRFDELSADLRGLLILLRSTKLSAERYETIMANEELHAVVVRKRRIQLQESTVQRIAALFSSPFTGDAAHVRKLLLDWVFHRDESWELPNLEWTSHYSSLYLFIRASRDQYLAARRLAGESRVPKSHLEEVAINLRPAVRKTLAFAVGPEGEHRKSVRTSFTDSVLEILAEHEPSLSQHSRLTLAAKLGEHFGVEPAHDDGVEALRKRNARNRKSERGPRS